MIGVKKNGEVEFLAQTPNEGGNLTYSHKFTLALGQTNQDRHVHFLSGGERRFQENQVRNIEVADCHPIFLRFLQEISQ